MEKKEDKKYLQLMASPNISKLIEAANERGITKENFVSLNKSEGEFYLTYYM